MVKFTFVTVALSGLVLAAAAASGDQPSRTPYHFNGSLIVPAGELCNFTYRQDFVIDVTETIFGDAFNPSMLIDNYSIFARHTNVDTGYSLTEVDHYSDHLTFTTIGTIRKILEVGLMWHLRDSDGKIVAVRAGEFAFDFETGDTKVTPNSSPGLAALICPALGGNPAP